VEFHELANLFPMMKPEELGDLVADVKKNGLIEPIVLYEEKILDGRNRYLACGEAGIKPHYDYYRGDDPLGLVISKNLHRRHLNETQRAVVASRIANMKQGERTDIQPSANWQKVSQQDAADQLNVGSRTVARVKQVEREAPELMPKLESGEMTVNQAITQIKKAEVIANLESVEVQEAKEIQGVYDVIVIDPPWPMEKIERDVAPNQVKFDYPTMTEAELADLHIPYADDCHIWLWTTHKHLPMALRLLNCWGMKYVCTFVWHKPGGFQPFGLPQYNCEFALYARKGSPEFIDFKDFMLCFDAPRNGHSVKPDKFYDLVRRVTAGRRLDMFNRRSIDGFDGWGKEAM
jgi:N6-adenosine-specific RNA methylase IME4